MNFNKFTSFAGTSLSIPRPTNAAGMPTHRIDAGISQEHFYAFLEEELKKIEKFTKHQVTFLACKLINTMESITVYVGDNRSKRSVELWRQWRAP